ncbi:hypothetical protein ACJ72_07588, partial [Emergomyces africanus]
MSTTHSVDSEASNPSFIEYEQFILFGDSITQGSCDQGKGFAFTPALQNGQWLYIRAGTRSSPALLPARSKSKRATD